MAAGRIHNFAFFLLTFYFLKLINQFESIMQNKPNFRKAQMNVTSFYTVDYENKRLADAAKTNPILSAIALAKAEQSQYKPNTRKAKMNVNSILTKDYERNDIFAVPENKANSNPTCRGVASGEAGSNPISKQLQGPPIGYRASIHHSPITKLNPCNLWLKKIYLFVAFISWVWY